MASVRRKRPAASDVVLELQVRGGCVFASVKPPPRYSHRLEMSEVPIDQAVVAGLELATEIGADVAVVDPYGLWPE